ncbi:velvet factor-domain-containing protein, partial [Chytriomyces cf. hyalinus JEL632]
IHAQLLIGSLVCEAMDLTDANNKRGLFFCFPDLAIRCSGYFRLRFEAYHLGRQGSPLGWVVSDVFQTFSPKTFPGNVEPTALSRTFLRQGVSIRMRDSAAEQATAPKRGAVKKKAGTKDDAVGSAAQCPSQ